MRQFAPWLIALALLVNLFRLPAVVHLVLSFVIVFYLSFRVVTRKQQTPD